MKKSKRNKQVRFLKLSQDIVFKSFFSRNKKVLSSLLKNFLSFENEITDITILNPEKPNPTKHKSKTKSHLNKMSEQQILKSKLKELKADLKESSLYPSKLDKKQVVLDLRVKLSTGENINVEMQTVSQKSFLKRILFYWSKLYSQDLEKGESYDKINPAYSLIFTSFPVLDTKIKDFVSSFSIRRDKEPYELFNEDLKIVIVEMSKFNKAYDELLDLKEKWCYLLKESANINKEEYSYLSKDEEIKMALKHLNTLSKEEELYQESLTAQINKVAYDLDRAGLLKEGRQEGRQEGLQEGLQEGRQENQIEIALNMLKEKLKISFISKMTGLSKDKVKKLKEQL